MHQAAGGACPELDLEHQQAVVLARVELHLTGLHVTAQGRQAQAIGVAVNHLDGPVPGSWHLHQQLVGDVQTVVAELTGVDVDHLGGHEPLEIAADPFDEPARYDVGIGDTHLEEAMEEATAAVLSQLHPAVDGFRGQLRGKIRLVTPALAASVERRRFPQIPPRDQRCTQQPP
ncbi:hypothetical protein ACWDSD_26915 [Streptomyces spiralis]